MASALHRWIRMNPFRKTLLGAMALALTALLFSGCQTLEGAGKDIEDAGEAVQDAAN